MKGEIEVFAPSLLSVLFPGNAILHGGKQLESIYAPVVVEAITRVPYHSL